MRTIRRRSFLALGAACLPLLAAGGCKWTDFDDLKEDTWVTSTGKPDNAAASWAVAIARLRQSGSGGTLAVLGATEEIYNDVVIGPTGDVTITNELELGNQLGIGNLALEPLLLSRPDADEAALVTMPDGSQGSRILVIRSTAGELKPVSVAIAQPSGAQPSGATYMVSPPQGGTGPQTQVLVAQGGTVFGAFFDSAPSPQPACVLRDDAAAMAAIDIRALGAYRPAGAAYDDIIVLTSGGKLMVYDGVAFNGCMAPQAPRPGLVRDLGFTGVQTGSQIITLGDMPYVLVQMHDDSGGGRLGLYQITASSIDEIGAPRDAARLKTAALFEPTGDAKRYVLAGMPSAIVDGADAGQVQVIEVDLTTGFAATPAMTLFDAQPQSNQAFGRGVAELPYNGKKIIAVAADNDVFLYFRTTLYGETREGR